MNRLTNIAEVESSKREIELQLKEYGQAKPSLLRYVKLAAYEDTGLTPEELTKLYKMIDITDLREHISELLDLEQQGRLKRFHKIGDEVYILYNASDDDKSPLHVVNKCKVKYQYSDWLTDESDMSIVYGLEGIEPFSNCTIIDFEVWEDGIFSTKEEAKKALEAGI